MSERAMAAVPLLLVLLFVGWLIRDALRTGTVSSKGVQLMRAKSPGRFGLVIIVYCALALLLMGFLALLLLR